MRRYLQINASEHGVDGMSGNDRSALLDFYFFARAIALANCFALTLLNKANKKRNNNSILQLLAQFGHK